jgi:hypothetical protein
MFNSFLRKVSVHLLYHNFSFFFFFCCS